MVLYKIISVFLFIFILKVSAFPGDSQTQDLIPSSSHKSLGSLKEFYGTAKSTLDKFQSCGTETHLEIVSLALLKYGDYKACVNATREIANYEEVLIDLYFYVRFIGTTFFDLIENILGCRHEGGILTILNCTVTQVQNSGPEFDEILTRAQGLIEEVQDDTDNLVYYIKKCFSRSSSEFFSELNNLIEKC